MVGGALQGREAAAEEGGWKNGGEAQLAAASNWAERFPWLTSPICSGDLKGERGGGMRGGVGGWAGGREVGHTPAASASL